MSNFSQVSTESNNCCCDCGKQKSSNTKQSSSYEDRNSCGDQKSSTTAKQSSSFHDRKPTQGNEVSSSQHNFTTTNFRKKSTSKPQTKVPDSLAFIPNVVLKNRKQKKISKKNILESSESSNDSKSLPNQKADAKLKSSIKLIGDHKRRNVDLKPKTDKQQQFVSKSKVETTCKIDEPVSDILETSKLDSSNHLVKSKKRKSGTDFEHSESNDSVVLLESFNQEDSVQYLGSSSKDVVDLCTPVAKRSKSMNNDSVIDLCTPSPNFSKNKQFQFKTKSLITVKNTLPDKNLISRNNSTQLYQKLKKRWKKRKSSAINLPNFPSASIINRLPYSHQSNARNSNNSNEVSGLNSHHYFHTNCCSNSVFERHKQVVK